MKKNTMKLAIEWLQIVFSWCWWWRHVGQDEKITSLRIVRSLVLSKTDHTSWLPAQSCWMQHGHHDYLILSEISFCHLRGIRSIHRRKNVDFANRWNPSGRIAWCIATQGIGMIVDGTNWHPIIRAQTYHLYSCKNLSDRFFSASEICNQAKVPGGKTIGPETSARFSLSKRSSTRVRAKGNVVPVIIKYSALMRSLRR